MQDEHLKDYVGRVSGARSGEAADENVTLPKASGTYRAYARAMAAPVYTLHCLLGPVGCRSFQYVHLDSDSSFTVDRRGQLISLKFLGSKATAVLIKGRNLRELYDYIHQHKTAWVMQADRDFEEGDDAVITSIEFPELDEDGDLRATRSAAKLLETG